MVYFSGKAPELMGEMHVIPARGKEVCSFAYAHQWLQNHPEQSFDPELQLYSGPQFAQKQTFGMFMDSAPDRWGRRLMLRREALRARRAGESPRPLTESDFLLGVYDVTRMGALRFKLEPDGNFQNDDTALATPPWARLRELEEASRHLEEENDLTDHEKWLAMLIAPGSSLGGARPKASVIDPNDKLWIAKFPSRSDENDIGAWEWVVWQMARDAGIEVPVAQKKRFSKLGTTFLTQRFDRTPAGRIHFASAMTLLGRNDGDDATSGCSYLDLAKFIVTHGATPTNDLRELWRRMVFSIAVSNTDDHLRNHGFLLGHRGWRLAPAYDINPNPSGTGLTLNIDEFDNALDYELALSVTDWFSLPLPDARKILSDVRKVVARWAAYAQGAGIPRAEMEIMRPAFDDAAMDKDCRL